MGVTKEEIRDESQAELLKSGYVYTKLCGWIDLGHAIPKKPLAQTNVVSSGKGWPGIWDSTFVFEHNTACQTRTVL